MKWTYTFLVLAVLLTGCGRFIPTEIESNKLLGIIPIQYGKGSYQATQQVRASREDIFRQARRWAAFHVPDPSAALSISDNMLGDIITYGSIASVSLQEKRLYVNLPSVQYSASIECYDNAYRVTLTNFVMQGQPTPHPIEVRNTDISKKRARLQYEAIDQKVITILESIDGFIRSEVASVPR
ncbi:MULTISPECIES: DUF4468 domain-containing protein [unclassified Spirosoma]|uniref:DUF4468 domain-containing protein n=1 Tax=unclassified Spirosoma TaxID=2621999 RepID=UPI00095D2919|nr:MULTISPECIES: DUF4468 domain-containing protein [unclassified Spirosoma]MBN8821321.1 DUF4468 domain-containing protein [Spirosoma sp.]OJW78110.1 MAG: hypothetical protein BGO59_29260 [Spirosoma sp. 48-14]